MQFGRPYFVVEGLFLGVFEPKILQFFAFLVFRIFFCWTSLKQRLVKVDKVFIKKYLLFMIIIELYLLVPGNINTQIFFNFF